MHQNRSQRAPQRGRRAGSAGGRRRRSRSRQCRLQVRALTLMPCSQTRRYKRRCDPPHERGPFREAPSGRVCRQRVSAACLPPACDCTSRNRLALACWNYNNQSPLCCSIEPDSLGVSSALAIKWCPCNKGTPSCRLFPLFRTECKAGCLSEGWLLVADACCATAVWPLPSEATAPFICRTSCGGATYCHGHLRE